MASNLIQVFMGSYHNFFIRNYTKTMRFHSSETKLVYSSLGSLIFFIFYEHLKHQNHLLDDDEYVKEHLVLLLVYIIFLLVIGDTFPYSKFIRMIQEALRKVQRIGRISYKEVYPKTIKKESIIQIKVRFFSLLFTRLRLMM